MPGVQQVACVLGSAWILLWKTFVVVDVVVVLGARCSLVCGEGVFVLFCFVGDGGWGVINSTMFLPLPFFMVTKWIWLQMSYILRT